jgi:hypothetical protein
MAETLQIGLKDTNILNPPSRYRVLHHGTAAALKLTRIDHEVVILISTKAGSSRSYNKSIEYAHNPSIECCQMSPFSAAG